jgi:hypothetical protein
MAAAGNHRIRFAVLGRRPSRCYSFSMLKLTPVDISEAQRLVRECVKRNYKLC